MPVQPAISLQSLYEDIVPGLDPEIYHKAKLPACLVRFSKLRITQSHFAFQAVIIAAPVNE
eukprot:10805046-Ditylum_brightwellii.AAC.1